MGSRGIPTGGISSVLIGTLRMPEAVVESNAFVSGCSAWQDTRQWANGALPRLDASEAFAADDGPL